MNELHLKILNNCSGKQYQKLVETYGRQPIDYLIANNYIVKLSNGVLTRTEEGLQMSKPLDLRENVFKSKQHFNLITDSDDPTFYSDEALNS